LESPFLSCSRRRPHCHFQRSGRCLKSKEERLDRSREAQKKVHLEGHRAKRVLTVDPAAHGRPDRFPSPSPSVQTSPASLAPTLSREFSPQVICLGARAVRHLTFGYGFAGICLAAIWRERELSIKLLRLSSFLHVCIGVADFFGMVRAPYSALSHSVSMNAKATRGVKQSQEMISEMVSANEAESQVPLGDETRVCGIVRNYRVHD